MFDDLRQSINKIRGDFSNNKAISIAVGREVVQNNLDIIYVGVVGFLLIGVLRFHDALLLAAYGAVPFVLDSSLFMESIPLVSRALPRVTVLIEVGMEFGVVSVGISLSVIYVVYRLVGALKMGIPYYLSLKGRDD